MTDPNHLLRSHPFVSGLNDNDVATLASCRTTLVSFEPDDRIVRDGEEASACFFIIDGDVALNLCDVGIGSTTIQTVHEGEIVGWSWLIPPYRGAFDATALSQVTAWRADAALLREAMERDREFGYAMMKRFCDVIVSRIAASRLRLIDIYDLAAIDLRGRPLHSAGHR